MSVSEDRMLKKQEAAHLLSVDVRTLERLIAQRKLIAVSVTGTQGGKRIPLSMVQAYMADLLKGKR